MKWIRVIVIILLSALAAAFFAAGIRTVELQSADRFTIDPNGDLYLLSSAGVLQKVSPDGKLEWSQTLPSESEDGNSLRYGQMISDRSGSVFIVSQEYERRVNAAGESEDVILIERIETYNGDGVRQDPVLAVDKTTLSEYSTESYFLKIQTFGDSLLAVCRNEG